MPGHLHRPVLAGARTSAILQLDLSVQSGSSGYVAPLLGLAFAFDAINGERGAGDAAAAAVPADPPRRRDQRQVRCGSRGHRPRPRHGRAGSIAAFGIIRLGIVPAPSEVLRIVLWVLLTFVYVALWLAFGMLLSVVVRRAATSALVGFGAWLLLTFFGGLIVSLIGGFLAPLVGPGRGGPARRRARRPCALLPDTLYREASLCCSTRRSRRSRLRPRSASTSRPAAIPSLLSLDQSFILVWPQVVCSSR